jgi:adenylate cyclase
MESLGHVYAVTGKSEEAARILAELDKAKWRSNDAEYGKLGIYVGLGDLGNAFKVLEKQAPDWQELPYELRLDPRFDSLRADPRYQAFLKKHFGSQG